MLHAAAPSCDGSAACHATHGVPELGAPLSVLLVFCGVLRDFAAAWRAAEQRLLLANPAVHFDVAVFADSQLACTPSNGATYCKCQLQNISESLVRLIGDRLVATRLIDTQKLAKHRAVPTTKMHQASWFGIRLADAWNSVLEQLVPKYAHMLVLRPDVELLRPFDVPAMCDKYPGFRVISGSVWRPHPFHNRDHDWALLACAPSSLALWLGYYLDADGSTSRASCELLANQTGHATCPPALPSSFEASVSRRGSWATLGCTARFNAECIALLLFAQSTTPLGTLDSERLRSHLIRATATCNPTSKQLELQNATRYLVGYIAPEAAAHSIVNSDRADRAEEQQQQQQGAQRRLLQSMVRRTRAAHVPLRRDGELANLAKLLNGPTWIRIRPWNVPKTNYIRRKAEFEELARALHPWTVAEPAEALMDFVPPSITLDCGDSLYSGALTGMRRKREATIVDFVPFGYDPDMLEVRLLDSFNEVDAFVVYEATRTQQGMLKPLYFNDTINSGRWDRFKSKIIHLIAHDADLKRFRNEVTNNTEFRWLEKSLSYFERVARMLPVQLLQQSRHPLAKKILAEYAQGQVTFVLQNDADEIVTRRVLHHLRHCETRGKPPIRAPCTSYWMNFEWLKRTCPAPPGPGWQRECSHGLGSVWADRGLLPTSTSVNHALTPPPNSSLSHFLHVHGPTVLSLADVLRHGQLRRYGTGADRDQMPELGPGAAIHLSTLAEPGQQILKAGGIIEANFHQTASSHVIKAARDKRLTPQILRAEMRPICHGSLYAAAHVSTLDDRTRALLYEALPWPVRHFPQRYPFMLVGNHGRGSRCCVRVQLQPNDRFPARCCWSGLEAHPGARRVCNSSSSSSSSSNFGGNNSVEVYSSDWQTAYGLVAAQQPDVWQSSRCPGGLCASKETTALTPADLDLQSHFSSGAFSKCLKAQRNSGGRCEV